MAIYDGFDVELTDSDIVELAGEPITGVNSYIVDRDVYEERTYPGTRITIRYLLFRRGQQITQAEFDTMLASAKDDEPAEEPAE